MSKYQQAYNQQRKKEIRIMVPEIDEQIRELEATKRATSDPDIKKGIDAKIKALKIKKQSYQKGDPVKEEAQGAVSTASVGVATATDGNTGHTIDSPTGSSYLHPKHMGTVSRKGDYKKPPKNVKDKKKKKKTYKEYIDFYFGEE